MKIKPLKTEKDLKKTLSRIDKIIDAKPSTEEYEELDTLSTLAEAYEDKHHRIDPPDTVDKIK